MGSLTHRSLKQQLKRLRSPEPMSVERALQSENPIFEVSSRLAGLPHDQMTDAEWLFFEAAAFLGDTLNGGLDQCLFNSTGDYFPRVAAFAEAYCDPRVADVLGRVAALFPSAVVPSERDSRYEALSHLEGDGSDPLGQLTTEFYALEAEYEAGLLALLSARQSEFANLALPHT